MAAIIKSLASSTTPSNMRLDAMYIKSVTLVFLCAALAGCSILLQDDCTVLVRKPDETRYKPYRDVAKFAKNYWQYTALAANSYLLDWPNYKQKIIIANIKTQQNIGAQQSILQMQFAQACKNETNELIPTPGWYAWSDFPPPKLARQAETPSLFFSVWEHRTAPGIEGISEVAIVFRGTQADQYQDWISNGRWFIPSWLRREDQYDITRDYVSKAFEAEIRNRIQQGKLPPTVSIVAIGHSLGGGLAQQLAYALPQSKVNPVRVQKVIAFNSSPVTGYRSTPNPPRKHNAEGLEIDRIFEHGEALAYIRLPINIIIPPNKRPSLVKDLRFNLNKSPGGVRNHASRFFACELAEFSGVTNGIIHTKNWSNPELVGWSESHDPPRKGDSSEVSKERCPVPPVTSN
ncbi:lipase family protein [Pseudomonas schmalbachii]|uniref:Fungal lipase-type domain-containing protein n=1 Tax=Pseudomonas schmalbachii TaxID=2816993 RepID=A0ABS3TJ21_9PSED|nr:DUF6792 domain-containing protein [Pseudomonas schmalbachii]MBO3273649.1 hypothetical protein [Pseudomonas schmalbachii]